MHSLVVAGRSTVESVISKSAITADGMDAILCSLPAEMWLQMLNLVGDGVSLCWSQLGWWDEES